jgi:hypothetical protein
MTDPEKPNMRGKPKTQSKPNPANANTNPSLATRIQSSATGLAKSAFQPGGDLNNTLSSSTNTKAGPSNTSASNASAQLDPAPGSASASSSASNAGPSQESFRSPTTTSTSYPALALPEDEFQSFGDEGSGLYTNPETGKGKAREFETTWQSTNQIPSQIPHPRSAPEKDLHRQSEDGAAVIALLTSNDFDAEDPTTLPEIELDPAAPPPPLSASERDALDSFRRALPGAQAETPARITGSSLVPDIDTFLSQGLGKQDQDRSEGGSLALRDEVLASLPGAGDWVGVQERYHDEVWGFLEPVLEAAKTEIEAQGDYEGAREGPAVRRLKMILGHMGT